MSITTADVATVAKLARLSVPNVEQAKKELNQIIDLVQILQGVDTQHVAPLAHPIELMRVASPVLRHDEAQLVTSQTPVQANAPAMRENLFIVPRVVE